VRPELVQTCFQGPAAPAGQMGAVSQQQILELLPLFGQRLALDQGIQRCRLANLQADAFQEMIRLARLPGQANHSLPGQGV